ncbi:UNVERIFIED_CONTAM: hypothetical protein GTU68_002091 [Idotea baltica]|nr:hypothetical protein [Idotea baltica]
MDTIRVGIVKFFNDEKGYGFITDLETKESIFVHINNVAADQLLENNRVSFEVEMGPKGPNAIKVKMAPAEVKKAAPVIPPAEVEDTTKETENEVKSPETNTDAQEDEKTEE